MRKIIFLTFLLFLLSFESIYAVCKHEAKIKKCNSALEAFIWKKQRDTMIVWWSLKDFKDFPCIQNWDEARVFQIAMDENFSKIDEEMDKYLKDFYDSKWYFFEWWNSFFEGIEQIFLKKDEFKKRYNEACAVSLTETLECTKSGEQNAVSILWAINFIQWAKGSGSCYLLADTKSNIFLEIAYNWLLLNSSQIFKDRHKEYTQNQRDAYGRLMEAIRINQSYIERLNSKWTSKTKHVHK